jgi:hypothetical protein
MNSKIIKAIGAGSLILGMVALSGCFESSYPDYGYGGYGYGGGRAYYSEPAPVIVREYDRRDNDRREYRDRDDNNHRVVVNHDHDRDVHASRDRDHDHDSH